MTYTLTAAIQPCAVIRDADGLHIPPDEANLDYLEYLAWKAAGGIPVPWSAPTAGLAVQAASALSRSDTTLLRCIEAGVSVPAAWTDYRQALRAIVSGADTVSSVLPDRPAYPV